MQYWNSEEKDKERKLERENWGTAKPMGAIAIATSTKHWRKREIVFSCNS